MSAPTTPAEMADWLEAQRRLDILPDEMTLDIIAYLRRQPTDAQKIEALKLASDAGALGCDVWQSLKTRYANSYVSVSLSTLAARDARKALRLLGLPTE